MRELKTFHSCPQKPLRVNFAITYKCNSKCLACEIWRFYDLHPQLITEELSVPEVKKFFSQNYHLLNKVKSVQITGGEPFLRTDLEDIIRVIHEILPKAEFWISTNGLLPNVIKREVKKISQFCKKLGIGTSLDGSRETHDKMRGMTGAYDKTIETITELVNLRKQLPFLYISVGMTITPFNLREINNVYKIAKDFAVDFSLRSAHVSETYYKNIEKSFDFSSEDIKALTLNLKNLENDMISYEGLSELSTKMYFIRGIVDFIKNPQGHRLPCYAGSESFFLDPFGNVFPCIIMNEKMGNIRNISLKDVWDSKKAEIIRDKIRQNKCPNCWTECETFPNIDAYLARVRNPVKKIAELVKNKISGIHRQKQIIT